MVSGGRTFNQEKNKNQTEIFEKTNGGKGGERVWTGYYILQNLLLQSPPRDQPINIHDLLLPDPMRPVHGLQILLRVPVVLHEDDRIRPRQIQPQPAHARRQQQAVIARIRVELIDNRLPLGSFDAAVETKELYAREKFADDVVLDDIEHFLHLAEDEGAVLADVVGFGANLAGVGGGGGADTAVDEEIAERAEFGGVGDVFEARLLLGEGGLDAVVLFVALFDDEGGGVAELAHVLEGLEDVLFGFLVIAAGGVGEGFSLLLGEVFEELLLEVAEIAVVVLENLGREIVEYLLFESAQKEREDLLVQCFDCQCTSFLLLGRRLAEATCGNGFGKSVQEDLLGAQEAWHEEVEK